MLMIPLQSVPAQVTKVILGGQNCRIRLYQKNEGLFVDLNADGVDVITCALARDADLIVSRQYVNFIGNLMFIDTQGNSDPNYTGLNGRFSFVYLSAAENDAILSI